MGEKVTIPMTLVKEALKNVSFIGGMDHCICREANKCTDFPQDFGCLFFFDIINPSIQALQFLLVRNNINFLIRL